MICLYLCIILVVDRFDCLQPLKKMLKTAYFSQPFRQAFTILSVTIQGLK